MVGAKMGRTQAVTERAWCQLSPEIDQLTNVALAVAAAEYGKNASTIKF
jgi:hypothetical protein